MGRIRTSEKKLQTFNLDAKIGEFMERMGHGFNKSEWANEVLLREVETSQMELQVKKAQELDEVAENAKKEKERIMEEVAKKMEENKTVLNEKDKRALETAEYKLIYAQINDFRREHREIVNEAYKELKDRGVISPDEKTIWQLKQWKGAIETKLAGLRPEVG